MTIGDFWHIEETIPDFYDPDGNSLFLIHTNRGEELFEKIQGDLDYRLSNTTQCWQANLEASTNCLLNTPQQRSFSRIFDVSYPPC